MDICVHTCVDICKCTCLQENDEMNLIPVYAQTKVSCSCKHMHMCIYATHNVLVFGGNLLILPASPFRRVLVHTTCLFAPCHEPVWQTCFVVNVTLSAMSCVLTPLRVATCVTRTTDIKHLHVIWLAWANVSKRSYCKTRQGPQKAFMSFCAKDLPSADTLTCTLSGVVGFWGSKLIWIEEVSTWYSAGINSDQPRWWLSKCR